VTEQEKPAGLLSTVLLKRALDDATAAVEKVTTLRGASARKVAYAVLDASGSALRAEHSLSVGAGPARAWLLAGLGALLIDLTLYGATAAGKNPRTLRVLAGAAVAARAGLYALSQHQQRQTRARICNGLAAGVAGGKP
jgi:hypothetical protein